MSDPLQETEKIRILLAEHNTLRSEIIARIGHAYQMLGYGLTAVVLLATLSKTQVVFWAVLPVILILFSFGLWVCWRDGRKAAGRIREIELDVNERANEDLLVWENLGGAPIVGIFGLGKPLPRSHLALRTGEPRTWRGKVIALQNERPQLLPPSSS